MDAGRKSAIYDILSHRRGEFDARFWREKVDPWLLALDTFEERKEAWEEVAKWIDVHGNKVSKGHAYFRLGHLHLQHDSSKNQGIEYLQKAYEEDKRFGPAEGQLPQAMGAYTLLSFVEDFLNYLGSADPTVKQWMKDQLKLPHRSKLFDVLLTIYNESLRPRSQTENYTHRHFEGLFKDSRLLRFAAENYRLANSLIAAYNAGLPGVSAEDQYALARATIGLYGGTFESILADWFPCGPNGKPTLGSLIRKAREAKPQVIKDGTSLAGLSIFLLYFRNHIHPDREVRRNYDVGMQIARGVGVALKWAIGELGSMQHP